MAGFLEGAGRNPALDVETSGRGITRCFHACVSAEVLTRKQFLIIVMIWSILLRLHSADSAVAVNRSECFHDNSHMSEISFSISFGTTKHRTE